MLQHHQLHRALKPKRHLKEQEEAYYSSCTRQSQYSEIKAAAAARAEILEGKRGSLDSSVRSRIDAGGKRAEIRQNQLSKSVIWGSRNNACSGKPNRRHIRTTNQRNTNHSTVKVAVPIYDMVSSFNMDQSTASDFGKK
ncbi:hypothetical protein Ancab_009870 [Ancistrocladus abbreviatus]